MGEHDSNSMTNSTGEMRALSWDWAEQVTDVIFEAHEKAAARTEVAIVIVDNNCQETHVSFHMDYDTATMYSKYFVNYPNVTIHILDPKATANL